MFKELFETQKKYLNAFFDQFDLSEFQTLVNLCANCKGMLIFTGIGKSGVIAQKISQTLLSIGTKAIFLPAVDALHGDIGIVSDQDLFFCLSKSGQTKELMDLILHVQKRKAKVISVSCDQKSSLAKKADLSIYLPIQKELCPFNLAPTISTTVQLLFGDALAVALMKIKKVTLQEYASNHPAGSIGKKTSIYVKDLMIKGKNIPTCSPQDTLIEVIAKLSSKQCGCLVVINEEKNPIGIFTDGDLRRGLEKQGEKVLHKKIEDLMTLAFVFAKPDTLAWSALQEMEKDPKKLVSVLPVLQEGKLVGIIRMHDILQVGV